MIKHPTILACTRIRAQKGTGSGTIIWSKNENGDDYSTYVLTNHHVVADSIRHEMRWNNTIKRDIKTEILETIGVHLFRYLWEQRATSATAIDADIVAYDKIEDLALLRLRDTVRAPSVVKLYSKDRERQLYVGQEVVTVGAALGSAPIITVGYLSQFGQELEGREYWLQTAPIIFGNSGGAVFLSDTEEMIGVPALVAVNQGDAITHMSYMIPITRVHKFLTDQRFRFIFDSNYTEEGEMDERERLRKTEEARLAVKEVAGEQERTERSR
jgi:S1-C subfamily serine protease